MGREAERAPPTDRPEPDPPSGDSAGVYYMSIEEFEGRAPAERPGEDPDDGEEA